MGRVPPVVRRIVAHPFSRFKISQNQHLDENNTSVSQMYWPRTGIIEMEDKDFPNSNLFCPFQLFLLLLDIKNCAFSRPT